MTRGMGFGSSRDDASVAQMYRLKLELGPAA
jgi:hypothetical protein